MILGSMDAAAFSAHAAQLVRHRPAACAPPRAAAARVRGSSACAQEQQQQQQHQQAAVALAGVGVGLLAGSRRRNRHSAPALQRAATDIAVAPSPPATPAVEQLPCTRGVLPNGLRYVVVNHAVPAGRFEAHLEFHVGSVDEKDDQRGMAHMLEHICFLGSDRRTELQARGIGMTSNALTDFQHTVYHLSLDTGHLAEGLGVLLDVGFQPAFASERVEKERKAVLSEAQMVNDVHYRLQLQMLGAIHSENPIHTRFPIGLESQISSWTRDELLTFHRSWYTPENATLFLVGDLPTEKAVEEVQRTFGGVASASGEVHVGPEAWNVDPQSLFRPRMPSRPAVLHDLVGEGAELPPGAQAWSQDLKVSVGTNELLQGMQLCWAVKGPLQAASAQEDLLPWICDRLVVEAVRLRLQTRWCMNAVPCDFHCYDSSREGVQLTTLTIMTEPSRWADTTSDVLQEVRAVATYGMDEEELHLTLRMLLGRITESAQAQPWALMGTMQGYKVAATSREVAEALIASSPGGHLLTNARTFSQALETASAKVNLEMLNKAARALLRPFGGQEGGPSGAVIASCPASVQDPTGRRTAFTSPSAADVRKVLLSVPDLAEKDVRSRRVSIPASLLPSIPPVEPLERHVLPGGLVSLRLPNGLRVRLLVQHGSPDGPAQSTMRLSAPGGRAADALSGSFGSLEVGLRTLQSSGVGEWSREQVHLLHRLHSVAVDLRPAAHVAEVDVHFAPSASSCRAGLEWLHWLLREPQLDMTSFNEAQLRMKGNALSCEKTIFVRAKQALLQRMYPRDMWLWEAATLQQVSMLTLGQARKAVKGQLGGLDNLRLDVAATLASGAGSSPAQGSVSGMSHEEAGPAAAAEPGAEEALEELRRRLETEVCSVLGSLPACASPVDPPQLPTPCIANEGCELREHVLDVEERAVLLVGGGAPNIWGEGDATWKAETSRKGFSWGSSEPLLPALSMKLMLECINGRLLGRVRDQLSLTYSCSMDLTMFDGFPGGYFICKAFASPDRLAHTAQAVMQVLRSPAHMPFLEREIVAAKKVLAWREAQARRENGYLVAKMRPLPGGGDACVGPDEERRVLEDITSADVQRAWGALTGLEDPFVVLATAGSAWVQQMVPQGDIVARTRQPAPAPAASSVGGGASLSMLD